MTISELNLAKRELASTLSLSFANVDRKTIVTLFSFFTFFVFNLLLADSFCLRSPPNIF